jgi:hypothetical protein
MSPHAYTEDQLVEQPAMFDCFAPMGWALASSRTYSHGSSNDGHVWVDDSGLFGRETKGEVAMGFVAKGILVVSDP